MYNFPNSIPKQFPHISYEITHLSNMKYWIMVTFKKWNKIVLLVFLRYFII